MEYKTFIMEDEVVEFLKVVTSETFNQNFTRVNPMTLFYGIWKTKNSPIKKQILKTRDAKFNELKRLYEQKIMELTLTDLYVNPDAIEIDIKEDFTDEKETLYEVKKINKNGKVEKTKISKDDLKENDEVSNWIEEGIMYTELYSDKAEKIRKKYGKILSDCIHCDLINFDRAYINMKEFSICICGELFPDTEEIEGDDEDDDEMIYFSEEAFEIILETVRYMRDAEIGNLELKYLYSEFFRYLPEMVEEILNDCLIGVDDLRAELILGKNKNASVPANLQGFVFSKNDKEKDKKFCIYCGREEETEFLYKVLQKRTKRNAILLGHAGVGKTSIINKLAWDITHGRCPEEFKNVTIFQLDVTSTIAGTPYRGEAEDRFKALTDYLQKVSNVILFIDEIHLILGAGACREGELDLANSLKPVLAEGNVRVIGATTIEEYEKYFKKDSALTRRFNIVNVKEPTSKEVYPMLKNSIKDLSNYHHGVKISKSMVDYVVLSSACFYHDIKNPDRTIDLIDMSMITAYNKGKKQVDKESVKETLNQFYKKFKSMSMEEKKIVAVHETGHYANWLLSDNLNDFKCIAVSIMPANKSLGVTVTEETEKTVMTNYDYYVDYLAFLLGGNAAEELYFGHKDSGASQDLIEATETARKVVNDYGLGTAGKNRIYLNKEEHKMYSETVIDNLNQEVDKIVDLAMNKATEVIKNNKALFDAIVSALLKNGILSENDLNKICSKYIKAK